MKKEKQNNYGIIEALYMQLLWMGSLFCFSCNFGHVTLVLDCFLFVNCLARLINSLTVTTTEKLKLVKIGLNQVRPMLL